MAYYCIAVLTVSLSVLACSASLICYNCTGVINMDACQDKDSCGENEVCFNQRKSSGNILYDLGCIESKKCGNFADLPSGISKMENDKGQTQPCFECCSKDRCNINLCQYKDPSLCVDDEKINCAYYNALFNFCEDVDKAKIACPKYCNLCRVDGNWTPWSNLSDCDVTCDTGTQVRTRSCTDPAPQYGGLDCLGNDTETKSCQREPCPIHGGWNTWSAWSDCSVPCDIGMQHRDRLCTNPRPSLFGDHCFGNSREDRICMPGACADGGWTDWGSWGTCSESCAGGVMLRNRACSNPAPSIIGKQCMGNFEEVRLCNRQACLEHNVAFTAWDLYQTSSTSSATLRFQKTYINYGGGYNTATGMFTCKVNGVYHFVVSLLSAGKDIDNMWASLRINGYGKQTLYFNPHHGRYFSMTGTGTYHLNQNDVVDVIGIPSYLTTGSSNSIFTGFLITPDQ